MSSEWTNNDDVYQLALKIKEDSVHNTLMHMHDGQVFRLDKYQMKVKKVQIYFLFRMWKKRLFSLCS